MARTKTVIKKYGNRRLYDSTASRYVNLQDIARMIREGTEVEVRDARSGKDLTRVILTEIIAEDVRGQETGLPLQLLRQLVVASDRVTQDFLSYLDTAVDLYQKAGATVRSGVSEARQAVTSPVDFLRHLVTGPAEAEVQELRRRVQELEARLAERPKARLRRAGHAPGRTK